MIDFKHFNSLIQVTDYFTDNDTCKQAIAETRWSERFADMFCKACKLFAYVDVLSLSSVVDAAAWREKHNSYYWISKSV